MSDSEDLDPRAGRVGSPKASSAQEGGNGWMRGEVVVTLRLDPREVFTRGLSDCIHSVSADASGRVFVDSDYGSRECGKWTIET